MKRVQVWLWAGALSLGIVASLVAAGWAQGAVDGEAESKLVKSVIDDTLKASNARNIDLMLTQYSDDAKIDSKAAGAKISKSAYRDVLTHAWARNPDGWAEYGKEDAPHPGRSRRHRAARVEDGEAGRALADRGDDLQVDRGVPASRLSSPDAHLRRAAVGPARRGARRPAC